jgi:copper chaperone CopZ
MITKLLKQIGIALFFFSGSVLADTVQLKVTGMHCESCANTIREKMEKLGLKAPNIDPDLDLVILEGDIKAVGEKAISEAIKKAGYTVVSFSPAKPSAKK